MTIIATPEKLFPIPTNFEPEEISDLLARAQAAFNTAEFLVANGWDPDPNIYRKQIERGAREAVNQFTGSPNAKRRPFNVETAQWLKGLVDKYQNDVIEDTIKLRTYVTTRLIEESDPTALGEKAGDRLRALESLGRLSTLGMFADKLEISVNSKSTDELKEELAKKLSRYMGDVEEVKTVENKKKKTVVIDLDEELGKPKTQKLTKDVDFDD
jgi:hypothetical protein